ncbi:hypothetical protein FRACYDRAFT_233182 [Fragilariopsis cylindrus CCMP1102]|uniref:Uncharacterized protein n=1 Tax=Fragilariopsis cylindrus CCMP1102 TaxID=635003 RepID=A0A1E7FY04_9STRA|nr:hypothetical protein FRACYDRAFT_233182 [Fragilariopsis cylindrus CCMP1102]|eukprot:OEU23016.1 hypothetical protein FRACYDRAFT_233182 [Fragilariopsis cylindrus CCMP1102]
MTTNDPSTSTRAVLCFQDAWDEHCSAQPELKVQTVSGSYDGNEDADVSSVFFELANAPSVSYRLQASDSIDDDEDDSNNDNTAATKTTSNYDAIVIRQDVSAETHTGGIVWETSYLLLNYLLSSNNWLIRNQTAAAAATCTTSTTTTILELGAGCGMLGLTLHKALELGVIGGNDDTNNKWRVILTETDEVMDNLRSNLEHNYPPRHNSPNSSTPNNTTPSSLLSVDELDWTRYKQDCVKAQIDSHSVDYIVGTDVVFSTRFVVPMLETMQYLSHKDTVIYLCLQERCKDSHQLLLMEAIKYGFHIHDISQQVFDDTPSCDFGHALELKTRHSRKAETKKINCLIEKVRKTKIDLDNLYVYLYVYSDEVCADDEYFNPEGLNIATLL